MINGGTGEGAAGRLDAIAALISLGSGRGVTSRRSFGGERTLVGEFEGREAVDRGDLCALVSARTQRAQGTRKAQKLFGD